MTEQSLSDLDRAVVIGGSARVRAPGCPRLDISQWQCETQNVSQNQDPDIKHYRDMIGPWHQREGVQNANYGHGDQQ